MVDLSSVATFGNDNDNVEDSTMTSSSKGSGKNQWNSVGFRNAAHQLKKFLSPNVKSRDAEFKRLFEMPETECYITSYSCAFQKEILIHGKLYLSQNYICFYSNIFGWETKVTLSFKNLRIIKKKRTAKFIPNAIQIATKAEVWAWSHYGTDEDFDQFLIDANDINCNGITEDEGYTKGVPVVCIHRASIPDVLDRCSSMASNYGNDPDGSPGRQKSHKKPWRRNKKKGGTLNKKKSRSLLDIPDADSVSIVSTGSDSSDDMDKEIPCGCPVHEGKEMLNTLYPISVDQMFLLLFTDCQFYRDLQEDRKSTDLVLNDWCVQETSGTKSREISYRVQVNNPTLAGNKTAGVVESQVCETCSNSGKKCIVKCVCQSSGVTYADTFNTFTRYCITRVSANQCRLKVFGGISYNKSCWGVVKNLIEKHAMSAMVEYFRDLDLHLKQECKRYGLPFREINTTDLQDGIVKQEVSVESSDVRLSFKNNIELVLKVVIIILLSMFLINLALYYKIMTLESSMDLLRSSQKSSSMGTLTHWEDVFEKEQIHFKEQRLKWTRRLDDTVAIVQQIENSLKEFRTHLLSVKSDIDNRNE